MNDRKRARLKAIVTLLDELRYEECRDLKDTPDNIENSEFTEATFRHNIAKLRAAQDELEKVK